MTETGVKTHKHRIFLIDILRILCALQIYMYHSSTMYGCTYGHTMDALLRYLTSPVMTCFFVLSGFSIHYQHRDDTVTSGWTRQYLKKRLITIMPSYLLVALIWPIAYPVQISDWVALLPVDLVGAQTAYRTLFGILHNGGTWFVSCMLLAYLVYPVIKCILDSEKKWVAVTMAVVTHFMLMYSNVVIPRFGLDGLYSNPIARTAEFTIGVSFAEIVFSGMQQKADSAVRGIEAQGRITSKKNWGGYGIPLCIILAMGIISVVLSAVNHTGTRMMVFEYLVIPLVLVVLLISSYLRSKHLERSRVLSALSGMSYQFFLTQLFLWNLTVWLLGIMNLSGNTAKIAVSFVLCSLISYITWKFYDKSVRRVLNNKILSKRSN